MLPLAIAGVLLIAIKSEVFGFDERYQHFLTNVNPATLVGTGLEKELPKVELRENIYVLVFDELSSRELYRDERIKSIFPHFQRLSETARSPHLSTTTNDSTFMAILTMLNGIHPDFDPHPVNKQIEMYAQPNLFDAINEDSLFVWGTLQPYCRTLRFKKRKSYCIDDFEQMSRITLAQLFELDLYRLAHLSVFQLSTLQR